MQIIGNRRGQSIPAQQFPLPRARQSRDKADPTRRSLSPMTTSNATTFATIMFLTGVGIPILAALHGGLGARLGSPMAPSGILFGLAIPIPRAEGRAGGA